VVSLLAKSLMHGLLLSGMANCGKHFPGHGFVKADSHTDIPVDNAASKPSWPTTPPPTAGSPAPPQRHARPRDLPQGGRRPAGFSSKWLNDILRRQLGLAAAIFSDDLSMAGARLIDGQRSVTPRPRWPR
jgi:beta-N-acetylhexosaminidase